MISAIPMKSFTRFVFASILLLGLLPAAPAAAQAQDVVTVGTVSGSGVIDVPVYIRDVSGTPLGIDQPAGSRIQAYTIDVAYAPASPIQSVTFTRAGITAPLTPAFEQSPQTATTASLIDVFSESANLVPFVSNAPAPGNLIGHLTVRLKPGVAPGTVITLTLDPVLTQLGNQTGTTAESVGFGNLALVNGQITVLAPPPPIPTLTPWALLLFAIVLAFVATRMRL